MLKNVSDWAVGDILCITEIDKSTGAITNRSTMYFIDNIIIWSKIGMISSMNQVHFTVAVPNVPLTWFISHRTTVVGKTVSSSGAVGDPAYAFGNVPLNTGLLCIEWQWSTISVNAYVGFNKSTSVPFRDVNGVVGRQSNATIGAMLYDLTHVSIFVGGTQNKWFRLLLQGNQATLYRQLSSGVWDLLSSNHFSSAYPFVLYFYSPQAASNALTRNTIAQ